MIIITMFIEHSLDAGLCFSEVWLSNPHRDPGMEVLPFLLMGRLGRLRHMLQVPLLEIGRGTFASTAACWPQSPPSSPLHCPAFHGVGLVGFGCHGGQGRPGSLFILAKCHHSPRAKANSGCCSVCPQTIPRGSEVGRQVDRNSGNIKI